MNLTRIPCLPHVVVCCALVVITSASAGDRTDALFPANPRTYFDGMTRFLSSVQQFQTTARIAYDVVQESGQKIEFSERHRITVFRPDRLRVDILKSNGEEALVLFDGKKITASSATHGVYARSEQPGDLDNALVYFLRDLEMRVPLAIMFRNDFPVEMQERLQDLTFVEVSAVTDTPSVHLAGRTDEVDFEVWIPQVGDPLPSRVTITYRDEVGQPKFWTDFLNWNLTPTISPTDFTFEPPAGAERIPFLAEIDVASPIEFRNGGE